MRLTFCCLFLTLSHIPSAIPVQSISLLCTLPKGISNSTQPKHQKYPQPLTRSNPKCEIHVPYPQRPTQRQHSIYSEHPSGKQDNENWARATPTRVGRSSPAEQRIVVAVATLHQHLHASQHGSSTARSRFARRPPRQPPRWSVDREAHLSRGPLASYGGRKTDGRTRPWHSYNAEATPT